MDHHSGLCFLVAALVENLNFAFLLVKHEPNAVFKEAKVNLSPPISQNKTDQSVFSNSKYLP